MLHFSLDGRYDPQEVTAAISGASGIWLSAPDQSRVLAALEAAAGVRNAALGAWGAGAALMADDAAAAALGRGSAPTRPCRRPHRGWRPRRSTTSATFGEGANRALSARYVLLDSFVDSDTVQPK